jgi:ATP-binding cassette subfamily B protein
MMTRAQPGAGGVLGHVLPALRAAFQAAPVLVAGHTLASVAAGVLPVLTVWLLKLLIDALTGAGSAGLWPAAAGFVIAGFAASVLPAVIGFLSKEVERAVRRRAQSDLYAAMARCHGLARLEDPEFRDRLQMAQQGGQTGPGQAVQGVIGLAQALITLVGMIGVLAAISPLVTLFALGGLAPALVAEFRLTRAQAGLMFEISPIQRREFFYAQLQTSIAAGKELRLLGLFELFRNRMLGELGKADLQRRRMDVRELATQTGLGALSAVILGAGIIWAVGAAGRGELGVGDLSAFVAGMTALLAGLSTLVARVSLLQHALLLYGYFREVLAAEPDLPIIENPLPVPPLRRCIEFRDVWFRYDDDQEWVLRGVDLVIPHGSATALVGLNGAGKTSLVKLLCRFYDPQRGAVLWDGVDLRELSVVELRERIGALFQDYMSYDLTVADNIRLGDITALPDTTPPDDERIRAAAANAGIASVVERLPRGYRTLLSKMFRPSGRPDHSLTDGTDEGTDDGTDDGADDQQHGVLLSGGQWQRLALARTLLRDRRDLLILDEPNSGLDAEAEHEIHRTLREHREAATSVLISHRLGTVRDADRIAVLAHGRIVEQGSHDSLLEADGEYARLFRLQADGYQAGPNPLAPIEFGGAR